MNESKMNGSNLLRHESSTFSLAFRLLPRTLRKDAYLLYAVFRTLDDVVDNKHPQALARIEAVENWCRRRTVTILETQILETIVRHHDLPRGAILSFCKGMRCDISSKVIETEKELDHYCFLVSGSVGVLLASLFSTRCIEAKDKAAALGMAMQRTNIIRDIDEDFANGRIYIARETIKRFGSIAPGQRTTLIRDQISRADALYEQGVSGIPLLLRGQRATCVAANLEREILRQIERKGYMWNNQKPTVPNWRKLLILTRCIAAPINN